MFTDSVTCILKCLMCAYTYCIMQFSFSLPPSFPPSLSSSLSSSLPPSLPSSLPPFLPSSSLPPQQMADVGNRACNVRLEATVPLCWTPPKPNFSM